MLRLEHVCVRWSLSVCVWGVCVCERERGVLVCVCVRERDGVLVCVGGCVRACVCVCVCRGVLCGGCNLSVHGFIIER